jgi:RHS repeat-associated protein
VTTVVNHLIYDAFGRVTAESNSAIDSLFLFTARPFDADTHLQNNLNRWYDAHVGRWLSEDPIGFSAGDGNLYRYVGNRLAIFAALEGCPVGRPSLRVELRFTHRVLSPETNIDPNGVTHSVPGNLLSSPCVPHFA